MGEVLFCRRSTNNNIQEKELEDSDKKNVINCLFFAMTIILNVFGLLCLLVKFSSLAGGETGSEEEGSSKTFSYYANTSEIEQYSDEEENTLSVSERITTDRATTCNVDDPIIPHESDFSEKDDEDEFSEALVYSNPLLIPDYSGEDYIYLNDNIPMFTKYEIAHMYGEIFSELDDLGRCGTAMAMISRSMMPTEPRGEIGGVTPAGWHTIKYPDVISDNYLYNRCHLIAYSMTGQNANELNLITGTRYFNVSIMLPFEYMVVDELEETENRVLYRVSPLFVGEELIARGVEMEAYSVEDDGESLCFHVFCYNVQPGIGIDYLTGDSWELEKE